jgi:hypothetical protein
MMMMMINEWFIWRSLGDEYLFIEKYSPVAKFN